MQMKRELSYQVWCDVFKGFYLFLNTTKQIKDSSFFLTNLHLKVFDLKMICSYFPRSNRWTFLSQQRNHITHSFNIFHSIFLLVYHGFLPLSNALDASECGFFTIQHEIKEVYQPSLFQLTIFLGYYFDSHRYRINLIVHAFPLQTQQDLWGHSCKFLDV